MQNSESISCEECRSLLFDYVTDNMSEQKKSEVLLHIKSCPECKREFEEINKILGAAAEITDVEVPESLRASVFAEVSAVASDMAKKRTRIYKYAVSTFVPIAACAAIAIGIFSGGFYDKISDSENMLSSGIDTVVEKDIQQNYIEENDDNVLKEQEEEKIAENNIDISDNSRVNNITSESGSALPESRTNVMNDTENQTKADKAETTEEPALSGGGSSAANSAAATEEVQPFAMARDTDDTDDAGIALASECDELAEEFMFDMSASEVPECEIEDAIEDSIEVPDYCIVVTDKPADFVSGFGIEVDDKMADEFSFKLSVDRWREFVEYNRGYGAEFSAGYSESSADVISITVKAE